MRALLKPPLLTGLYCCCAVALGAAIVAFNLSDLFLFAAAPPVLVSGYIYRKRRYYATMVLVLNAVSVPVVHEVSTDFYYSLNTLMATTAVLLVVCESLHRLRKREIRTERALRESEEKYRAMAENVADLVWTMGLDGTITYMSPSVTRVLGYAQEEVIGRRLADFLDVESYAAARRDIEQYVAARAKSPAAQPAPAPGEYLHRRKDGSTVICESTALLMFDEQNRPVQLVGVTRDISERKRSEEALHRRDAVLEAIAFASERFLQGTDWERDIEAVLERLGRAAGVIAVYVFKNWTDSANRVWTAEHSRWEHPDAHITLDPRLLSGIPYRESGYERWESLLSHGTPVCGRIADLPGDEGNSFAVRGSGSIAIVPVFVDDEWWGFIGFDYREDEREWSQAEIEALRTAASLFGAAIRRERALRAVRRREATLDAVAFAAERFLTGKSWEDELPSILARLGEAAEVASVYVFRSHTSGEGVPMCSLHARWLRSQDEPHTPAEDLQNVPWQNSGLERWRDVLSAGGSMSGRVADLPAPERNVPLLRDIASVAVVPVFDGGTWWGIMGLDTGREQRQWSNAELDAIRTAAVTLGAAIRRAREEEEHHRFQAQLQHTQKLESLGVLAGGIAHDFNNLLMGILGNTDLARTSLLPGSPVEDNLSEIEIAARRAADLCRQMLAYSGRGRFHVEAIDLSALVREMGHLLSVSISKKVTLAYDLPSGLPAIEADATQVRQVVMNLITNASEAIGDHEGVVAVSTGSVQCEPGYFADAYLHDAIVPGTYVFVEVRDTGCGMPEEMQSRIFDPFHTTKFTGRGLGLAAVLGIVRSHAGAIKLTSKPGQGSTFRIYFPATARPPLTPVLPPRDSEEWHGTGSVLVIEDEAFIRELIDSMLAERGFTVLSASDGMAGVEFFRANASNIALVILDMTMPKMDGIETYKALMAIREDIPVVLISGYTEEDTVRRFPGSGPAGFLQKPFSATDLIDKVRSVLS